MIRSIIEAMELALEWLSANLKLVESAFLGLEGSYVELLTVLALMLLAVAPIVAPKRNRQLVRHANQLFGLFVFVFVVFSCLGVFGMVRNLYRGLTEIGRENIIALYYCSVPAVLIITAMLFGPVFCGWICPTGALQEFTSLIFRKWHRKRKSEGYPFSGKMLAVAIFIALIFLGWMIYITVFRVFHVDDSSIYWSQILVIILFLLVWGMGRYDMKLRRLRVLSLIIIIIGATAHLRITSPVHFGFCKVYDPSSHLATVMIVLAALAVPHVWCRYLCPWREAISWAGKRSVRRLTTDHTLCNGCGKCSSLCGVDAIKNGKINRHECHMCLKCVDNCPTDAIKIEENWGCAKSKPDKGEKQ